jgi:hypothetical protein
VVGHRREHQRKCWRRFSYPYGCHVSLKSLKRHEGWLLIDHSASPGIPYDVAIRMGVDPRGVAGGKKMEAATVSCKHCGGHVVKNPKRVRPRGYCRLCDHYICDACDVQRANPNYVHRPIDAIALAAMNSASRGAVFNPSLPEPVSIIVP